MREGDSYDAKGKQRGIKRVDSISKGGKGRGLSCPASAERIKGFLSRETATLGNSKAEGPYFSFNIVGLDVEYLNSLDLSIQGQLQLSHQSFHHNQNKAYQKRVFPSYTGPSILLSRIYCPCHVSRTSLAVLSTNDLKRVQSRSIGAV